MRARLPVQHHAQHHVVPAAAKRLMRESGVDFRGGMLHEPPENGGEEQVLAGEGGVSEGSSITAEKRS